MTQLGPGAAKASGSNDDTTSGKQNRELQQWRTIFQNQLHCASKEEWEFGEVEKGGC